MSWWSFGKDSRKLLPLENESKRGERFHFWSGAWLQKYGSVLKAVLPFGSKHSHQKDHHKDQQQQQQKTHYQWVDEAKSFDYSIDISRECFWNFDWDGRHPKTMDGEVDKLKGKDVPNVTSHFMLIRHGQYNLDNNINNLTPLGRLQSALTGLRLREMMLGVMDDKYGRRKISIEKIFCSNLVRARETADIIRSVVIDGDVGKALENNNINYEINCSDNNINNNTILSLEAPEVDPVLAECWPYFTDPMGKERRQSVFFKKAKVLLEFAQANFAFRKYIHRFTDYKKIIKSEEKAKKGAEKIDSSFFVSSDNNKEKEIQKDERVNRGFLSSCFVGAAVSTKEQQQLAWPEKENEKDVHKYYVIVAHMNVIRYFVCRALQLPPSAWLRFRGDNCGITELIVSDKGGTVSLARFGDTGHLAIGQTTFH